MRHTNKELVECRVFRVERVCLVHLGSIVAREGIVSSQRETIAVVQFLGQVSLTVLCSLHIVFGGT